MCLALHIRSVGHWQNGAQPFSLLSPCLAPSTLQLLLSNCLGLSSCSKLSSGREEAGGHPWTPSPGAGLILHMEVHQGPRQGWNHEALGQQPLGLNFLLHIYCLVSCAQKGER